MGFNPGSLFSWGGGKEESSLLVMRVGACADELRLMGGERELTLDEVFGAVRGSASLARKVYSA